MTQKKVAPWAIQWALLTCKNKIGENPDGYFIAWIIEMIKNRDQRKTAEIHAITWKVHDLSA